MENVYQQMRKKYKILIDNKGKPIGWKWNYDVKNRKRLPKNHPEIPSPLICKPDKITQRVITQLNKKYTNNIDNDVNYEQIGKSSFTYIGELISEIKKENKTLQIDFNSDEQIKIKQLLTTKNDDIVKDTSKPSIERGIEPDKIGKKSKKEAETKAKEILDYLGLSHRYHHKPNELSGGEQQRVAVARALINNPAVILADEPSGNLDSQSAENLHDLFFKLRDEFNQTFVIVTHNETLADMADRKLVMKDGVILWNWIKEN